MASLLKAGWSSLACKRCQLNLRVVLTSGQSFRWRETASEEFTGVMRNIVWTLSQTDDLLLYKVHARFEAPRTKEENKKQVLSPGSLNTEASNTTNKLVLKRKSKSQLVVKKEIKHEDVNSSAQQPKAFLQTDLIIDNSVLSECKPASLSIHSSCEAGESSLETKDREMYEALLKDYFQLDVDIQSLYRSWSERDAHFSSTVGSRLLTGIRLLRQDPVETLLAFISSSNNNISRISGMVQRMCAEFGHAITEVDGHTYFTVPSISRLALTDVESKLRDLGFGYRAKYISQTAQALLTSAPCRAGATEPCSCPAGGETPSHCLCLWRSESYTVARAELMKLSGIGPKVADCVCLMSLDKHDVVPVDTHVWQIASRDYNLVSATSKTLTDNIYRQIGDGFRELWGPYAGWAQAVLFASEVSKVAPVKRTKKQTEDKKKVDVKTKTSRS